MDSLQSLIPFLNRGDAEAWRSLVRALSPALFRFLRAQTGDDDAATELVQQTFVRLLGARIKPSGTLRAYVFRIALNCLRNARRDLATRRKREQEAAMPEAVTNDPQRSVIANETWQAALRLPDNLRQVVLLRYGQGFTAAETAAVLGIPEGTVKTRQRKALEDLRGSALATPALIALEGDLHAAATATQVPTTLAPNLEALVMASIGTKTGTNAGILALAALLLLGGIGTGAYFLTGNADNQQPGQSWPGPETTAKSEDERPNDAQGAPPVMAGPDATDQQQSPDAAVNATPGNGRPSLGSQSDLEAATGDEPDEEAPFRARIAGRVVDYNGFGVANANVHIEYYVASIRDLGGSRQLTKRVTIRADARGLYSFEIESDRPGEDLTAHIAHYAMPPDTPRVIDPRLREVRFTLRNGEERTGIRLLVMNLRNAGSLDPEADDPENPELGSHPYRATFTGRVVDEQGMPVAGATVNLVYLWWLPSNRRLNRTYEKGPVTATDETGTFLLTLTGSVRNKTVTAGIILAATAKGMAAKEREALRDVANGATHEVSLILHAAGTARGRLVDDSGAPVFPASVWASLPSTGYLSPASVHTRTDPDGNFELTKLAPGRWTLRFMDTILVLGQPSKMGVPREPVEFEIAAGAQIQLPDIVLLSPTTVVIKPLQEDGKPFARGTEVTLTVQEDRPGAWVMHRANIDRDGRAVFRGIEPGTHEAKLTVTGLDVEEHRLTLNVRENEENDTGEIRLRWARDKAD